MPDVDFKLPDMYGSSIDEHFRKLAETQISSYVELANALTNMEKIPPKPTTWAFTRGWTKYTTDGDAVPVDFPEEPEIVFDIEILVPDGHYPTMATAMSTKHW